MRNALHGGLASLREALHAEWAKLCTLPGTPWLVAAIIVLTVAVSTAAVTCPSGVQRKPHQAYSNRDRPRPACYPEPVPGVARRNVSRIRRGVLGVGVSVVLVTVVGCGTTRSADLQPPAAAGAASERRTITIDPQVGETFAPAPASAAPKLTAQQAWARYMRQNGDDHTAIPSVVRVQLGLLTLPIGPTGPTGPGGAEAYTHVLTNPNAP